MGKCMVGRVCAILLSIWMLAPGDFAAADSRNEAGVFLQLAEALPDSVSLEGKVVYVDFWASWCVPCRKSFPWMKSMSEKYNEAGLLFMGVNLDADTAAAHKFMQKQQVTFPTVFDPQGEFARMLDLQVMRLN